MKRNSKPGILPFLIFSLVLSLSCNTVTDIFNNDDGSYSQVDEEEKETEEPIDTEEVPIEIKEEKPVEPEEEEPVEVEEEVVTEEAPTATPKPVEASAISIEWELVVLYDTDTSITAAEQVVEYIKDQTGIQLELVITPDFTTAMWVMSDGGLKMTSLDAFTYLAASQEDCAIATLAAVRFGSSYYNSQIMANADIGISTIKDLRNSVYCRPDSASISGWKVPSLMLMAAEIDPYSELVIVDTGDHSLVPGMIFDGNCDAGSSYADVRDVIEEDFPDIKAEVPVIETSPNIPLEAVVFHPDIPQETIDLLTETLFELANSEEGQQIFYDLFQWDGVEIIDDSFYDPIRNLLDQANVSPFDMIEY